MVLAAVAREQSLTLLLEENGYAVVHVPTGALALEWARDTHPDAILLDATLPDMPGTQACRSLYSDPHVSERVPIILVVPQEPTGEERVAAIRVGAWDCVAYPGSPEELLLKLQTYVQSKRSVDFAMAEGMVDARTGLYSRQGLAHRARELGALMVRQRGAFACVVFSLEVDPADSKAQNVVSHTVQVLKSVERVSDVVGVLGGTEFAVLAPATDRTGAVKLADRIARALHAAVGATGLVAPGSTLRAGYDAVANLSYSPIDPVELLTHAITALRSGTPEPQHPWVRRFDRNAANA
ncbi:MAG: response regulator [Gemmatimonadetes bacterium]|nr:response regulator [Gemmatimonadota bacterium]